MINLAVGLLVAGLVAVSLESGGVALVLFGLCGLCLSSRAICPRTETLALRELGPIRGLKISRFPKSGLLKPQGNLSLWYSWVGTAIPTLALINLANLSAEFRLL